MPFEGFPAQPYVIFWSGDILIYVRDKPTTKDGIPHTRIYMTPTEQVMWRYNIDPDSLNYKLSEHGVLEKEYPSNHVCWLSRTPENQVALVLCNYDGTTSVDHTLLEQSNQITRFKAIIKTLERENWEMRDKLNMTIERMAVLGDKK